MGQLLGQQIQPSDIASFLYDLGIRDAVTLGQFVQVCLAESQGRVRAFNDNVMDAGDVKPGTLVRLAKDVDPKTGELVRYSVYKAESLPDEERVVVTRDVGIFQINIPADQIGTSVEENLYGPSANVNRAIRMYQDRGFQPWVAYNTNVYNRDTYVKLAYRGVGNMLARRALARPTDHLSGEPYVHKLSHPVLEYRYRAMGLLASLKAVAGKLAEAKAKRDWAKVTEVRTQVLNDAYRIPRA